MIKISTYGNTDAAVTGYPYGKFRDKTTSLAGTTNHADIFLDLYHALAAVIDHSVGAGNMTGTAETTTSSEFLTALLDTITKKSVMTTQGDVIYGGSSGSPTRLPKGVAGQALKMNTGATAPEWADSLDFEIQTGILSSVALNSTFYSVVFGTAFTAAPYVFAQLEMANIVSYSIASVVRNRTTTGFDVAGDHSTMAGTGNITWIAINL